MRKEINKEELPSKILHHLVVVGGLSPAPPFISFCKSSNVVEKKESDNGPFPPPNDVFRDKKKTSASALPMKATFKK